MDYDWRDVVGYEGSYHISNHGDVLSLLTRKTLKPRLNSSGYYRVKLFDLAGYYYMHHVHILVLEAFVGLRPKGMIGRHINHIRTDNRVSNLVWGHNPLATKLTDDQTEYIKRHYAGLWGQQRRIAVELGISQSLVNNVITRLKLKRTRDA